MKVLALDTSTRCGHIALVEVPQDGPGQVLAEESFVSERSHNSLLFGPLERLLQRHGAPDLVAAGLGPGSYTGIRIGIAAAHGLATALGIRWTGHASLPTLDQAPRFHVVGDARRGEVFHAVVENGMLAGEPDVLPSGGLGNLLASLPDEPVFTTDPNPPHPAVTTRKPSAILLARLAARATPPDGPIEPLYLRAPYITLPKAGR